MKKDPITGKYPPYKMPPENSDWMRSLRWDLPPYKSAEFMLTLGDSLEAFKKTDTYKWAVERGDIVNDEWAR
jgi:hypothetical protein